MNTTNAVSTRRQRVMIFKKTQRLEASKAGWNLRIFVGSDGNARSLHFSNLVPCSIIVSYPKRFAQSSSAWIAQKKAPDNSSRCNESSGTRGWVYRSVSRRSVGISFAIKRGGKSRSWRSLEQNSDTFVLHDASRTVRTDKHISWTAAYFWND